MAEVVRLEDVRKYFPGVKALDGVTMSIRSGEVHALIGENGAGKSTLVKVLTGVHSLTSGTVYVDGAPVSFRSPHDSQAAGIAAIHQEASMFPNLTIVENIFMGHHLRKASGLLDWAAMKTRTRELCGRLSLKISPDTLVRDLSVAQRHQIEIVKALSIDARVIIMDEPTASLSLKEIKELYELVRKLREAGTAIVFISHKFEEIFEIADTYTVLRDGKYVGDGRVGDVTTDDLVRMMAGAALDRLFPERTPTIGGIALRVQSLRQAGVFEDISFELHKGEVLGFFGLVGAGRSELMQSIFGVRGRDGGSVFAGAAELKALRPQQAMAEGIAFVPEDRQEQGVILDMSIVENTTLASLKAVSRFGFPNRKTELATTERLAKRFSLRASSLRQVVAALSGGNQQKVVLSKWLATEPRILILDEPTRGIDVGTKAAVHSFIGELADQGYAIILVSSELHEVLGMSDRVLVMKEGRLVAEFDRDNAEAEQVLGAAIGATTAQRGA
ncbi:MAG: sugar ABC transporter ATP-binding protein [Spirochaetaceae bacterium]|nr:MAG: sugar ABC transporter ATP-binding protein [Spirochaetaceae bacterium]